MGAPSTSKTWQHTYSGGNSTNVRIVSSGVTLTDYQTVMLRIKNILIGFSNAPWTVRCSSKGTGAGGTGATGDGVDRWSTIADLVWANAASNHSWIVLRQTGIGSTFEICIDLSNTTSANATIAISPSATFTGGTATARPTATDEMVLCSNTTWIDSSTSAFTGVLTVMQSTDGQCLRVLFAKQGVFQAAWIIDKPAVAVTGWSNPVYGAIKATSGTNIITYANFIGTSPIGFVRIGSTNGAASMSIPSANGSVLGNRTPTQSLHDVSGEYALRPCGIVVPTTASARGRHGYFSDLWSAPVTLRAGETFPNASSRDFIVVGCLAMKWNGEEPRLN